MYKKKNPFGFKPPLAWGKDKQYRDIFSLKRDTSTCVGKIFATDRKDICDRVHPHMRGEDP